LFFFLTTGSSIRVEHYGFAQQQGRIAGKNIALLDAKRKQSKKTVEKPPFSTLIPQHTHRQTTSIAISAVLLDSAVWQVFALRRPRFSLRYGRYRRRFGRVIVCGCAESG